MKNFCPKIILDIDKECKVFEEAIYEHNIFSLKNIYENISYNSIEYILKLNIERVRFIF